MKPVAKTTSTHKKVSSSITVVSKQVVEDDNSKMLDLTMDSSDELTEIADVDQEKEITGNGAEKTTGTLSHTSVSTQTTRRTGLVYKTKRQKKGEEFRLALHEIGLATRRRQMDLAKSLLQKVKNRFMDPTLPASIQVRRVLHRSNAMEKIVFCGGDLSSVQKVLNRFLELPSIRTLMEFQIQQTLMVRVVLL